MQHPKFFPASELILNPDGSVYHLNLLPENIAENIITVGDPDRVGQVSQYFDSIDFRKQKREFITHTGKFKGKPISVISTGMGTDNIEILMMELDALVNIDLVKRTEKKDKRKLNIIRIGTSGSLQNEIPLDSHLVSGNGIGFDNLMNFYDLSMDDQQLEITSLIQSKLGLSFRPYLAQASSRLINQFAFDMLKGNTVTCPGFYSPQGRALRLPLALPNLIENMKLFDYQGFKLTNFEMETAGYYALGKLLGHEVISLNAIIANRITNQFSSNPSEVIDGLIRKVLDRI
ncbi:nucleoside phosphorylase [Flexithrix dorotheae]|uniref:nucleoside phosphorylase n=1 Tax=Flexithrix dorotheae TaxID=70993 RepID=UPI000371EAE8|nr:nucleoside phosphorylase [Flexithrix dorotheae]